MPLRGIRDFSIAGLLLTGCMPGPSSVPDRPPPAASMGIVDFPAECSPEPRDMRTECLWVTSSQRTFVAAAQDVAFSPSQMFDPQDLRQIWRSPEDFLRLVLYPATADWVWDDMEGMTTISERMLSEAELPEGADACYQARLEGSEKRAKTIHCVRMRESDDSVRMVSLLFTEAKGPGTPGPASDFDARADSYLGTLRLP